MAEKKAPPRGVPAHDNGYFEILTRGVFQSGFRWSVVEAKWPAFLEAFEGFDLEKVARYGPGDVDRLASDPGLIRNRRKIAGTIENAKVLRSLIAEHSSIGGWLATTADLPWPKRKQAVSKPFKYFGPSAAYFFLYSVGEATPPHGQEPTWTDPVPAGYPEAA